MSEEEKVPTREDIINMVKGMEGGTIENPEKVADALIAWANEYYRNEGAPNPMQALGKHLHGCIEDPAGKAAMCAYGQVSHVHTPVAALKHFMNNMPGYSEENTLREAACLVNPNPLTEEQKAADINKRKLLSADLAQMLQDNPELYNNIQDAFLCIFNGPGFDKVGDEMAKTIMNMMQKYGYDSVRELGVDTIDIMNEALSAQLSKDGGRAHEVIAGLENNSTRQTQQNSAQNAGYDPIAVMRGLRDKTNG